MENTFEKWMKGNKKDVTPKFEHWLESAKKYGAPKFEDTRWEFEYATYSACSESPDFKAKYEYLESHIGEAIPSTEQKTNSIMKKRGIKTNSELKPEDVAAAVKENPDFADKCMRKFEHRNAIPLEGKRTPEQQAHLNEVRRRLKIKSI